MMKPFPFRGLAFGELLATLSLVALGACSSDDVVTTASADASSLDAPADARGSPSRCAIDTATYDHTCTADTDCVAQVFLDGGTPEMINVASVDYCASPTCSCPSDAISVRGVPALVSDFLATPWRTTPLFDPSYDGGQGPVCHCPFLGRPHCAAGRCLQCGTEWNPCPDPSPDGEGPRLDSGADAANTGRGALRD